MKKKMLLVLFLICADGHICFSETTSDPQLGAIRNIQATQAIMQYRGDLMEHPDDATTYYNLGLALMDVGQDEAALEKLSKARDLFILQGDQYSAIEVSAAMGAAPFQKGFRQMQASIDNLFTKVEGMESKIESNFKELKSISQRLDDDEVSPK